MLGLFKSNQTGQCSLAEGAREKVVGHEDWE